MAFRSSIPDFALANQLYIGCSVAFYTVNSSGQSTGTLAQLFADPISATQVPNPQVLDSTGKLQAPVYIQVPAIGMVLGGSIPSHSTGIINPRGTWRGNWVTGTQYYSSDFVVDAVNGNIYLATQDYISGASVGADVTAGNLKIAFDFTAINANAAAIAAAQAACAAAATSASASAASASANAAIVATDTGIVTNATINAQNAAITAAAAAAAASANYNWNALGVAAATPRSGFTLPAYTYNNGAAGVGATITGTANGAFPTVDGVAPVLNQRYLIWTGASSATHYGVYQLSVVGDGGTAFVLTRVTDANTPALLALIGIVVLGGTLNAGAQYVLNLTAGSITIGTTALNFGLMGINSGLSGALTNVASDYATDAPLFLDSAKMLPAEIRSDKLEVNLDLGPRTVAAWALQFASQNSNATPPLSPAALAQQGDVRRGHLASRLAATATHAVPKLSNVQTLSASGVATQPTSGVVGETAFALWIETTGGFGKIYYSTWALHGGTPPAGTALLDLSALSLNAYVGAVKVDVDGATIHIIAYVFAANSLVYHYTGTMSAGVITLSQPHLIGGGSGAAGLAQAGRIEQLDDGTLLVAAFQFNNPYQTSVFASIDKGISWTLRATPAVGTGATDGLSRNEGSIVQNKATKEVLLGVRSNADGGTPTPVYFYRSQDLGFTWSAGVASAWNAQGNPWLEDIGGGAVAYFDRGATPTQTVGSNSLDFARNFGAQFRLASGGTASYIGMFPLPNRTFQTVWGQGGNVFTGLLAYDPQINGETYAPAPVSISNCTIGAVTAAKYRRSGDQVQGSFAAALTGVTAGAASFSFTLPETSSDLSAAAPNVAGSARDSTGVYGPGIVFSTGTTGKVTLTLPNGASTVIVRFGYDL